jgi:hypothetical protein
MSLSKFFKLFLITPLSLFALDQVPWFCTLWEFTLTPKYTYSRYPRVQNGVPPQQHPSNDHLLAFDLAVSPSPDWQVDGEIEFADTPIQSMGFRSGAFQAKYRWLDDLIGDPVSLTTGAVIRGVSSHSLRDVSCPYHSHFNMEVNAVVGREWDHGFDWRVRIFSGGALGMGNRGYPWASGFGVVEGQIRSKHRLGFSIGASFGMGPHRKVDVDHFNGYAFIHHQNVDVGVRYTYVIPIWGHLSLSYARRVFARSFPEKVNFLTVEYRLPFSLF